MRPSERALDFMIEVVGGLRQLRTIIPCDGKGELTKIDGIW